jgi:hypothetical protein
MPPVQVEQQSPPTFGRILYRIAVTAIAKASIVLFACMILEGISGQKPGTFHWAAFLAFAFLGGMALSAGMKAERISAYEQAGDLYAVALVNYLICFHSLLAIRVLWPSAV